MVWLLAPAFTSLIIPKETEAVNAVLPFSTHHTASIPASCAFIFYPLFPPSLREESSCSACQSVTEVSSSASYPPPAPQHLLGSVLNISLSVKTLTALLPARRASDPICTPNSLPGLFCLSLPNTCYLNSKSFFWG